MAGSVILAGARTPIGKLSGALAGFSAAELGGLAIKEALVRAGLTAPYVGLGLALVLALIGQTGFALHPSSLPGRGRVAAAPDAPRAALPVALRLRRREGAAAPRRQQGVVKARRAKVHPRRSTSARRSAKVGRNKTLLDIGPPSVEKRIATSASRIPLSAGGRIPLGDQRALTNNER